MSSVAPCWVRILRPHTVPTSQPQIHRFVAFAFVENFNLKELAALSPSSKRTHLQLLYQAAGGGTIYVYAFGAIVFQNVSPDGRETELLRLHRARPGLTEAQVSTEEFTVREMPGARIDAEEGTLFLDELTPERAAIVALTVAQSVAMEYYERIVDQMFGETDKLVDRLEKTGTMPVSTGPLYRFIGRAIGTRNEVISVLHLLDKPDAVWDDPSAAKIHEELSVELDLPDRYQALEHKLRSIQEALELLTDMARDRRSVLLETTIVILIMVEIALTLFWH